MTSLFAVVYFSPVSLKWTKLLQNSFRGQRPQGKHCSRAKFVYLLSRLYKLNLRKKNWPILIENSSNGYFSILCLNLNNPLINDKHKQKISSHLMMWTNLRTLLFLLKITITHSLYKEQASSLFILQC